MYVTRFELATFWSVARRSIQLSYTYILLCCSLNSKYYYSVGACICQPENEKNIFIHTRRGSVYSNRYNPDSSVSGLCRLRAVPSPESFVSGQFCFRSVHGGGSSGIAECTANLVFFVFSDPEPFDSGLRVFSREGRVTRCTVNRNVEVYDRLLICLK